MTSKKTLFLVALCLTCQLSLASRVIKLAGSGGGVLLSQDTPAFKEGDRVCLFGEGKQKPHACGDVIKANGSGAIVKITKSVAPAALGNIARHSAFKRGTASASSSYEHVSTRSHKTETMALGLGPIGNWNFFIGSIHAQYAPSPKMAFGLMPFYVSSGTGNKVTDFGAFATFNYYGGDKAFSGLWISAGAGFHKLHLEGPDVNPAITLTEDATALSLFGTVGWRERFGEMFHAGISGGALYTKESTTLFTLSFNGVVPIFLADVGIAF